MILAFTSFFSYCNLLKEGIRYIWSGTFSQLGYAQFCAKTLSISPVHMDEGGMHSVKSRSKEKRHSGHNWQTIVLKPSCFNPKLIVSTPALGKLQANYRAAFEPRRIAYLQCSVNLGLRSSGKGHKVQKT